jgi:hypothetical protein
VNEDRQRTAKFVVDELDRAGLLYDLLAPIEELKRKSVAVDGQMASIPATRLQAKRQMVRSCQLRVQELLRPLNDRWSHLHPLVAPLSWAAALHFASPGAGWRLSERATLWLSSRVLAPFEQLSWEQSYCQGPSVDVQDFEEVRSAPGRLPKHSARTLGGTELLRTLREDHLSLTLELLPPRPTEARPPEQVRRAWAQGDLKHAVELSEGHDECWAGLLCLLTQNNDSFSRWLDRQSPRMCETVRRRVEAMNALRDADFAAVLRLHHTASAGGDAMPPWDLLVGFANLSEQRPEGAARAFIRLGLRGYSSLPARLAVAALESNGLRPSSALARAAKARWVRPWTIDVESLISASLLPEELIDDLELSDDERLEEDDEPWPNEDDTLTANNFDEEELVMPDPIEQGTVASSSEQAEEAPQAPGEPCDARGWPALGSLSGWMSQIRQLCEDQDKVLKGDYRRLKALGTEMEEAFSHAVEGLRKAIRRDGLEWPVEADMLNDRSDPDLLADIVQRVSADWARREDQRRATLRARMSKAAQDAAELGMPAPTWQDDPSEAELIEVERLLASARTWRGVLSAAEEGRLSLTEAKALSVSQRADLRAHLLCHAARLSERGGVLLLELVDADLGGDDALVGLMDVCEKLSPSDLLAATLLHVASRIARHDQRTTLEVLDTSDLLKTDWCQPKGTASSTAWRDLGGQFGPDVSFEILRPLQKLPQARGRAIFEALVGDEPSHLKPWATWLWSLAQDDALMLLDERKALRLVGRSLLHTEPRRALLFGVAAYKGTSAPELLEGLTPHLLNLATSLAEADPQHPWLVQLLATPDWLLAVPGGVVALLELAWVRRAPLVHHGRVWQGVEQARSQYPALIDALDRQGADLGADPQASAATRALEEVDHDLRRESAFQALPKEGHRLQGQIRERFRALLERLNGGAAGVLEVRDELDDMEPEHLLDELATFEVEGKGRAHVVQLLSRLREGMQSLVQFQLSANKPDLRAALAQATLPRRARLEQERAALVNPPLLVQRAYARVLGEAVELLSSWGALDGLLQEPCDRIALTDWVEVLEDDNILLPCPTGDDEAELGLRWVQNLIAVYAGQRTLDMVLQVAISQKDYALLAQLAPRLEPTDRASATAPLQRWVADLQRKFEASQARARELLSELDLSPSARANLAGAQAQVQTHELSTEGGPTTLEQVSRVKAVEQAIEALSETITEEERALHKRRVQARRQSLDLGRAVTVRVFNALIQVTDPAQRRALEQALLRAPHAALRLNLDELAALELAVETGDFSLVPHTPTLAEVELDVSQQTPRLSPRARAPRDLKGLSLSPYTREELGGLPSSMFPDAAEPLDRVRQRARGEVYRLRRAHMLLAAALAHPKELVEHLELLCEGLLELAAHRIEQRRYNQATAIGRDAIRYLARRAQLGVRAPAVEQRAVAAVLLAGWLPTLTSTQRQELVRGELDRWFAKLPELLTVLRAEDRARVVLDAWEGLESTEAEMLMAEALAEADSDPSWTAVLLGSALSPALATRDPGRAAQRVGILLLNPDDEAHTSVLEELIAALSAFSAGEIPQPQDHGRLLTALSRVGSVSSLTPVVAQALQDAERALLQATQRNQGALGDPKVNATVIGAVLYVDELAASQGELTLPVIVNIADGQVKELGVELELSHPDGTTLTLERVELGNQEAGSHEVPIRLVLERPEQLKKVVARVRLLQGTQPLRTSSGRERLELDMASRRPGDHRNPYVTGNPLLPRSELFVGRRADVHRVLSALHGRGQDNVPLVLGSRRIGKTSLLRHLTEQPTISSRYLSVLVDLETLRSSDSLASTCRRLVTEVHDRMSDSARAKVALPEPAEYQRDPARALRRGLEAIIHTSGRSVLLLLDEFEKALQLQSEAEERQRSVGRPLGADEALLDLTPALRNALHHVEGLSLVISGTHEIQSAFQGEGRRLFGNMLPIRLKHLQPEDLDELLMTSNREMVLTRGARARLARLTGLHPYLLQVVLHELFARLPNTGRREQGIVDIDEVVRAEILPHPSYFTDLLALASGSDVGVGALWGLATAHNQARGTQFVSVEAAVLALRRRGELIYPDQLQQELERLASPEVGLVERAPNNTRRWKLTMELVGEHLLLQT